MVVFEDLVGAIVRFGLSEERRSYVWAKERTREQRNVDVICKEVGRGADGLEAKLVEAEEVVAVLSAGRSRLVVTM